MKPAPPVIRTGVDRRRRRRSCDQPPRFELRAAPRRPGRRAVCCATHSASSARPCAEVLPRREAEPRRAPCEVSQKQWRMSPIRALPTISGSMLVACPSPAPAARDLGDGAVPARADIEHLARRLGQLQRIGEGARHVATCDEIAALPAILEDHRRLAVEQARGEDREHAGIGIGERLARPVDVEEAQAHAFHPIGAGHDVASCAPARIC